MSNNQTNTENDSRTSDQSDLPPGDANGLFSRQTFLYLLLFLFACAGLYQGWAGLKGGPGQGLFRVIRQGDAVNLNLDGENAGAPTHKVSADMSEKSLSMIQRDAAPFQCAATDGETYKLADLLHKGPLLLTFTKVGCPCSVSAQLLFNQVAKAYPQVKMLGVVNAESEPAQLWLRKILPDYPQLLDPDQKLIRNYGVPNSAFIILIAPDGKIVGYWPGVSIDVFNEISQRLAQLTNTPEQKLNLQDAPEEMYTGCPFDL